MKSGIYVNNSDRPVTFWNARNSSYVIPGVYDLSVEDTNWVLTSSFIIFTMQTGFGMLESGCVSIKNEVNIMMKNIIDIVLGVSYHTFGDFRKRHWSWSQIYIFRDLHIGYSAMECPSVVVN